MAVGLLAAKLLLTPAVIAFIFWVEHRFGHALAGLLNGLPLTSAVAAGFLYIEQGPAFTRDAAAGMLAGVAALAAFLLGFAHGSRWDRWWAGLAGGAMLYVPVTLALSVAHLGFPAAAALAVGSLALAAAAMPRRVPVLARRPHGRWELPLRAAIGTAVVAGLTTAAAGLGPQATGLLLLFPAVTSVLASFVLSRAGRGAVVRMLRGMAIGCYAFVAFFVVVGVNLGHGSVAATFVLAALAALGASAVNFRLFVSRQGTQQNEPTAIES